MYVSSKAITYRGRFHSRNVRIAIESLTRLLVSSHRDRAAVIEAQLGYREMSFAVRKLHIPFWLALLVKKASDFPY
jgi:hypothetical protein